MTHQNTENYAKKSKPKLNKRDGILIHPYHGKNKLVRCPKCKQISYHPTGIVDVSEGPLERIWECTFCNYWYWLPDYIAKRDFDNE